MENLFHGIRRLDDHPIIELFFCDNRKAVLPRTSTNTATSASLNKQQNMKRRLFKIALFRYILN